VKLTHIHIENFLGAQLVDIELRQPVTLIAGLNGAGKSSVRDAVALALTGDLTRVALKKDAGQLVTEGAKCAVIEVAHDAMANTPAFVNISAAGKMTGKAPDLSPMLPFVLQAQRFARLTPTERRAFLFDLMGLKADGKSVAERLAARGCDMAKAERVAPLLRAGFDRACTEAKTQATQARGAWKAVTGEAYGSEKAKTWRAPKPGATAEGEPTDAGMLKACDEALAVWQRQIGALQAEQQRRATLAQKVPALQEQADKLARAETKLATDDAELKLLADELERLRAAAGGVPRVGLVHQLAAAIHRALPAWPNDAHNAAGWQILRDALTAYEYEHGTIVAMPQGNPEARARIPAVEQAHTLLTRAVANDRRDIEAAQRAQVELQSIHAELNAVFDAAALVKAQRVVEKLTTERQQITARLEAAAAVKRAAEQAQQKTADAARHHADVAAWELIADALAPNGIPAELLSEALDPINERLERSAQDAEWPRVGIEGDMEITADGRAYGLLSESEQWRVDAMVAEAIAHLSGLRLLVLDRFDVLDLPSRSDLVAWLDVLAEAGEIDTALIFGTLKALPGGLPSTFGAHWVKDGRAGQLKEAA
jgi:hypothetical protein